jgi:glycosyltransferase involved in cell wall biosynthesis
MTDKKIKLFVDAHVFDKEFQGTQTFIRELYTALFEKYSNVLDIYFGAYDTKKITGIFPFAQPSCILPYKKSKSSFLRLITDIPFYIKKYQFDFAHFQNVSLQPASPCKTIVTLHDVTFQDFPNEFPAVYRSSRKFLFAKSMRQASIKTSVSDYSRERISKHYKIPAEQIHVVSNSAETINRNFIIARPDAAYKIYSKFDVKDFILYVSRIEPRKNHLLLLNKYLDLQLYNKNIPLVFIGKESIEVPDLQKKIKALTAEQKKMFHWFQQVDQEELIQFYSACKLFVYPSKAEGFGIPPLEAAVCKAPVLCSNVSAMKDFNFFEPYTFNPANENEFEEKLKAIINDPPDDDFINDTAAIIKRKYSWKNSADIFYDLLISATK